MEHEVFPPQKATRRSQLFTIATMTSFIGSLKMIKKMFGLVGRKLHLCRVAISDQLPSYDNEGCVRYLNVQEDGLRDAMDLEDALCDAMDLEDALCDVLDQEEDWVIVPSEDATVQELVSGEVLSEDLVESASEEVEAEKVVEQQVKARPTEKSLLELINEYLEVKPINLKRLKR